MQAHTITSWIQIQVSWPSIQQCFLGRGSTGQAQTLPTPGDTAHQAIHPVQHLPVRAAP